MTTTSISNSDDVIDSRDVIARIEELQNMQTEWECPGCRATIQPAPEYETKWEGHADTCEYEGEIPDGLEDYEREELVALLALQDECEGYASDWKYGETLIRDSYFTEYAEEEAYSLGFINREAIWPLNHIDWEAAAEELKNDYTSAEFDGVTYWVRMS
jgi:hypothetical protein